MSPERWRQLNRLFDQALERPAAERDAFLTEACAGDEALRRKALDLLAADEKAALVERSLGRAAHQAGIIHRDIKPENLMLRPDG